MPLYRGFIDLKCIAVSEKQSVGIEKDSDQI